MVCYLKKVKRLLIFGKEKGTKKIRRKDFFKSLRKQLFIDLRLIIFSLKRVVTSKHH